MGTVLPARDLLRRRQQQHRGEDGGKHDANVIGGVTSMAVGLVGKVDGGPVSCSIVLSGLTKNLHATS